MSLSKPTEQVSKNPSEMYIEWKGEEEKGHFQYYQKKDDGKGTNVVVDLSKGFVILDGVGYGQSLFCIAGYDENNRTAYQSNEVREISDIITIRGYKDKKSFVFLKGTYEDLKDRIKESGFLKYNRCAYIMFDSKLAHLKLKTKAYSAFMTDVESKNWQGKVIKHTGNLDGKKGVVKYKFPVFEIGDKMDQDAYDAAFKLDSEILQPYLEVYLNRSSSASPKDKQESNFDPKLWRDFETPGGEKLFEIPIKDIISFHDEMITGGDTESDYYEALAQAVYEFQQAKKTWKDKRDQSGRSLTEYSLGELHDAAAKISPKHPIQLTISAAIEYKEDETKSVTSDLYDEEDDVPF